MFDFLSWIVIPLIISVLVTPLVLRIIFKRAGEKNVNFWTILGLLKRLKEEAISLIGIIRQKIFLTLQVDHMTSSLNEGSSELREELASKLLGRKE